MTPSSPPRRNALKCGVSSRPRLAVSSTPAPRLPTAPPPPASLLSPPLASRPPPKLRLFPLLVPVKTAPCPRVPYDANISSRSCSDVVATSSLCDRMLHSSSANCSRGFELRECCCSPLFLRLIVSARVCTYVSHDGGAKPEQNSPDDRCERCRQSLQRLAWV